MTVCRIGSMLVFAPGDLGFEYRRGRVFALYTWDVPGGFGKRVKKKREVHVCLFIVNRRPVDCEFMLYTEIEQITEHPQYISLFIPYIK